MPLVIDDLGRVLGVSEFSTTAKGLCDLERWLASFGTIAAVGIEGSSSYGAELTRVLTRAGAPVVEVPRPSRAGRRRIGKSDPIDAEAAARAVLAGQATVAPTLPTGVVESIRALSVGRRGACTARVASINSLHALLVTAPGPLRRQLAARHDKTLVAACARLPVTH